MTNYHHNTPPEVPGYEILRLIGLGGMGEVYLARQLALNRSVAIKFLSGSVGDFTDEYIARFRREAELMARVSHPNIVTIFDFGTAKGRPFLVMEYVEDGDLRSRMVPDVPMTADEVGSILRPVVRSLEYLHHLGIIHRDMKPENILIHHAQIPKVTDFGLAVLTFAIGSLTRTGRMMGTQGYVAPEQRDGLRVDERADQFSLAAVAYEMLTGRKPLGHYPPPSRLNPKLGRAADVAILRGLGDDPEDRFPTIRQFGEALEFGLVVAPRRTRPGRRAALAAGLAVLASLLAGGLYPVIAPKGLSRGEGFPRRIVARRLDMPLVLIPAGEFWMGSPVTDHDARGEEMPRHHVRLTRPFYLAETEVTVGQFRAFVEDTGYQTTAELNGGGIAFNPATKQLEQKPRFTWRDPGFRRIQAEDEPVVQISADDAISFCRWLSRVEGRPFRLPTEAEWEYACRAGTETRWWSGEDPASLEPIAWTLANAGDVLHPVGRKRPNPFGLHDMHGNAWEWCADWIDRYPAGPDVDPVGNQSGTCQALRGGSIDWDKVEKTRAASRVRHPPKAAFFTFGFRVCSPTTR